MILWLTLLFGVLLRLWRDLISTWTGIRPINTEYARRLCFSRDRLSIRPKSLVLFLMVRLFPISTPTIRCAGSDYTQLILLLNLLDVLQFEEYETVARNDFSSHASPVWRAFLLHFEVIAQTHVLQVSLLGNNVQVCGDGIHCNQLAGDLVLVLLFLEHREYFVLDLARLGHLGLRAQERLVIRNSDVAHLNQYCYLTCRIKLIFYLYSEF